MYTGVLLPDLLQTIIWMTWNGLLAVIPFLLAKSLFHGKRQRNLVWFVGFVVFVLFLPNAPYILTDSIHLYWLSFKTTSITYIVVLAQVFAAFLLLGSWLFAASYHDFEKYVRRHITNHNYRFSRIGMFVLVSIGVYLGRFIRLNSWDVVMAPVKVLQSVQVLLQPTAIIFVLCTSLFLHTLYTMYLRLEA